MALARVVDGIAGQPWTASEIDATLDAYLEMLRMELRGERYRKSEIVKQLESRLPARNRHAIEAKFQNISAIRDEAGLVWIDGYKPFPHYQQTLKVAVLGESGTSHRIGEGLEAYVASQVVAPSSLRQATSDVLVPTPSSARVTGTRTSVSLAGGQFAALHDF